MLIASYRRQSGDWLNSETERFRVGECTVVAVSQIRHDKLHQGNQQHDKLREENQQSGRPEISVCFRNCGRKAIVHPAKR
jgi:hypothetical protein